MNDSALNALRGMPREELESFIIRTVFQLRGHREEIQAGKTFVAALIGFLLGASVATLAVALVLSLG